MFSTPILLRDTFKIEIHIFTILIFKQIIFDWVVPIWLVYLVLNSIECRVILGRIDAPIVFSAELTGFSFNVYNSCSDL